MENQKLMIMQDTRQLKKYKDKRKIDKYLSQELH